MTGAALELESNFSNLSPGTKIFLFSVLLKILSLSFIIFNYTIKLTKTIPKSYFN